MPDDGLLWDLTRGAPPPQPMIANLTLAERRAAGVKDVLMFTDLIEHLCRNSDPEAIDNLLAVDRKTSIKRRHPDSRLARSLWPTPQRYSIATL
jgi:hypothetical protein